MEINILVCVSDWAKEFHALDRLYFLSLNIRCSRLNHKFIKAFCKPAENAGEELRWINGKRILNS